MTERVASGPYIVWEDYGYDGWKPTSYPSLKEALVGERYSTTFVVTKVAEYDVVDRTDE